MKKIILTVLVCFALIGIWAFKKFYSPINSDRLKNLTLHKYGSTVPVSLADLSKKATVVSFFQTWCGDCIREMPLLLDLRESVANEEFAIVMISDESEEKIVIFKNKFPNYQLEFYQIDQSMKQTGIWKYPTTFLLGKQLQVILKTEERYSWSSTETVKLVQSLLER